MRYRLYREHKYITYQLFELEKLIAKTDFKNNHQLENVSEQLRFLEALLKGHAKHEDNTIHELLRKKGSKVHELTEAEHAEHEGIFQELYNQLSRINVSNHIEYKLEQGYNFYLAYRLFMSNNLKHLHQEELVILPELQRLYSDDELRQIDFNAYHQMSPEQISDMVEVLFPQMDGNDHQAFLRDIKDAEPEKFSKIWPRIAQFIEEQEQLDFV
ncbi:MAG: s29x [Rickettsiaceae bacterium]|jgi:hemerythrin-like domain-containing protein|nr:s29x [Rickettsiaceae bacterium]